MKKKIVSALLTATMICGMSVVPAVGVAAADDTITVGFSQVGAESDWRTANTESMKSTFSEENGYELIFDDAQQKQENQLTAIRNFIQQEVDYIVLAPVTETGWDTVLQEAKDAGFFWRTRRKSHWTMPGSAKKSPSPRKRWLPAASSHPIIPSPLKATPLAGLTKSTPFWAASWIRPAIRSFPLPRSLSAWKRQSRSH